MSHLDVKSSGPGEGLNLRRVSLFNAAHQHPLRRAVSEGYYYKQARFVAVSCDTILISTTQQSHHLYDIHFMHRSLASAAADVFSKNA